jgi:hypothetical protein
MPYRVIDDFLNAADDLAAVDGADVRISGDEIVLKAARAAGLSGPSET